VVGLTDRSSKMTGSVHIEWCWRQWEGEYRRHLAVVAPLGEWTRAIEMKARLALGAGIAVVAMLVLAGCGATTGTAAPSSTPTSPPTQAPTSTPNPLVLAPATTPSVVGICSEQLTYGADGNAGPITCSNGAVNVLAWNYYVPMNAGLFTAGPNASPSQIESMECNGFKSRTESWTIPIGQSIYGLAQAYYGWSFGINPAPGASNYEIPNSCGAG